MPRLDVDGLELLGNLLAYEGKNRVSAREAMKHAFLASLPPAVHTLKDSEFSCAVNLSTVPSLQLTQSSLCLALDLYVTQALVSSALRTQAAVWRWDALGTQTIGSH